MGVPEVMKISSFMDSVKSPELAKRFASSVPKTVDEMMKRLDEFVRAEEAYALAELPLGESRDIHRRLSFPAGSRDVHQRLTFPAARRDDRDETTSIREDTEITEPRTTKGNEQTDLYRTGDPDKYCDYHQDKGHHTNDCIQLRKQLEIALESGKLNLLKKDLRQRWKGDKKKPSGAEGKLTSVRVHSLKRRKRKDREANGVGIATVDRFEQITELLNAEKREEKAYYKGRNAPSSEEVALDVYRANNCHPSFPDQNGHHWRKTLQRSRARPQCKTPSPRSSMSKEKNLLPRKKQSSYQGSDGLGEWHRLQNLNLTCPKDYYPLPNIDCKVEAVMGFRYKCFLDAYKGYHQIQMAKEDEEKTAFYTEQGTYCYTKMPFGLKNAGATYQRLVDSTFQSQIGRNLEAYVDDMVIKSKEETGLLADIAETFEGLKTINMKLNPKKCSFGVEEGKFLGYMVTSEGIRANPKKTKAISDLQSPKTLKEMQSLTENLASLKIAEEAFQQMKRLIMSLPSLTPPFPEETLYAYLAVSREAVSAVLLTDRNGRQCPVQYVSRTLNEAERNYSPLEKLALSLVNMTRRLRRYFEAHPVKRQSRSANQKQLIGQKLREAKPNMPWRYEPYKISFIPRTLVTDPLHGWCGISKGSGAGLILTGPSGVEYAYALRLTFASTNNEAEYEALLAGLRIARMMNVLWIEVKVDSKLVASQINGMYEASNGSMIKYLAKAREYISEFKTFSIENIPRGSNQKADVLSKLATVPFHNLTKEILVEVLNERSTEVQEVQTIVEEEGDNWMTPIIKYLEEGIVPSDSNEARAR
ncbi:reverse transcriptase domain-containing protein [Tanacetum coccineum]